MKNKNKHQWS